MQYGPVGYSKHVSFVLILHSVSSSFGHRSDFWPDACKRNSTDTEIDAGVSLAHTASAVDRLLFGVQCGVRDPVPAADIA